MFQGDSGGVADVFWGGGGGQFTQGGKAVGAQMFGERGGRFYDRALRTGRGDGQEKSPPPKAELDLLAENRWLHACNEYLAAGRLQKGGRLAL